jgi:glutamate-1-semialdehyde 2,1-aminomutase
MVARLTDAAPIAAEQDALLLIAERYMPGACLGLMWLPPELRMVMVRGCGAKLYDVAGNEYLDYVLGSGPLILGHGRPEVLEAVRGQLALGATYFALNEPAIRLAEQIVAAAPCGEAIRFQTTGSEATLAALRLARAFTAREKILKFEGGWHGGHDLGQLSAAPAAPPPFPAAEPDCDGVPESARGDTLVAPFNDLATTRQIIEAHAREIAAVIVEPMQRAITPGPGFLEDLREVTQRFGIVLVFDEIVTGFRLAWGGAQQRYGVVPDLACYGKAIGGGYPISAVVGRADILAAADPTRKGKGPYCFLSGTLTGNPVAAAAGLATLQVLEQPGTYERLSQLGDALRAGIADVARRVGEPVQTIGDGPVLQVFFSEHPIRTWRDCLKADGARAIRFGWELIRRRVYCTPGGKLYLSLAHTDRDLAATLDRMEQAMCALRSGAGGS